MHGLKWTRKTTRKVARQLRRLNIRVSAKTVGRLLKAMGFSLRVNHKNLESGNKNPPPRRVRNRQFRYINQKRKQFASWGADDQRRHEKEGEGRNFKNPGVSWEQKAYLVNDHDFFNDAVGMAVPTDLRYGGDRGFVAWNQL